MFSHTLTDDQIYDAKVNLGVVDFLYLPEDLQQLWTSISPIGEWDDHWLSSLKNWLIGILRHGDKVLVQGEYGGTLSLVTWLQRLGFSTYYTTTKRETVEELKEDGTVITHRVFKHVQFREYPNIVSAKTK